GAGGPMRLTLDQIRHGLRLFSTSFYEAPGRLNVYDEHPFKVILDYAHNPDAVEKMVALADRLDVRGKKRLVIAAPGDRRDEDVEAMARHAARHFDHYVCKRDDHPRGRSPEEIPQLLRRALLDAGVPDDRIDVVPDEQEAVDHALRACAEGGLLRSLGDDIARGWEQLARFGSEARREAGPSPTERGDGAPIPAEPVVAPAAGPVLAEPASTSSPAYALEGGRRVTRDRRGVRVVHDEDAD